MSRVLVVEDEMAIAELIALNLRHAGFEVTVVDNGEDAQTQTALLELCTAMHKRFVDPQYGVLMEKPLGAVDNWYEPGHQFEWYFLLESSALLRGSKLHAALDRAFAFTEQYGVVQPSGAVRAMVIA